MISGRCRYRRDWCRAAICEEMVRPGREANSGAPATSPETRRIGDPATAFERCLLEHLRTISESGRHPNTSEARKLDSQLAHRAINFIENNYAEQFTIRRLSQLLRCDATRLERVFKEELGLGIHNYRRLVRVVAALKLLRTSDLKIAAVAAEVGFRGRSTLYRALGNITGQTPAHWRLTFAAAALRSTCPKFPTVGERRLIGA